MTDTSKRGEKVDISKERANEDAVERIEFRDWAVLHGCSVPESWITEPQKVVLSDASFCAWEAWQAARAEQSTETPHELS